MTNLTFIPADVNTDVELLAWFEERMAETTHDQFLALQELDEEDHTWSTF